MVPTSFLLFYNTVFWVFGVIMGYVDNMISSSNSPIYL